MVDLTVAEHITGVVRRDMVPAPHQNGESPQERSAITSSSGDSTLGAAAP
jgi:hypothetical protein